MSDTVVSVAPTDYAPEESLCGPLRVWGDPAFEKLFDASGSSAGDPLAGGAYGMHQKGIQAGAQQEEEHPDDHHGASMAGHRDAPAIQR